MASEETRQQVKSTAKTWYQPKRVPLYAVVGLTFASAATFLLFNRTAHPSVEASHGLKKDGLAEERDSMEEEGRNIKESNGRKLTRGMGLHDGMNSDGIMPNTKIARKLGDVLGTTPKKDDK